MVSTLNGGCLTLKNQWGSHTGDDETDHEISDSV